MARRVCVIAGVLLLFEHGLGAQTQISTRTATPATAAASAFPAAAATSTASQAGSASLSPSLESSPRVPGIANLMRGFNAGLNYAAVHNSSSGWYTVATPALMYAFSARYSADINASVYFQRRYQSASSGDSQHKATTEEAVDSGDTLLGLHAAFEPGSTQDVATMTVSAPTGDKAAGLGTGRVTFDFTNHVEYYHRQTGMFADVGIGDSSGLFNNVIARNSNSLGALTHFLAGAEDWIGNRFFVEALAYEQLPLGSQKVYAAPQQKGGRPAKPIETGSGLSEDNGITTYLGIPLAGNLTLSGYYSRSLRHHSDTVSFGFTWVLHGAGTRWDALADRALREAEKPQP